MTDSHRNAIWKRIMAVQEQYNRLEREFADIPADGIGWWLRWNFNRSLDAMIQVRGAHSHGGSTSESERRLPKLEMLEITNLHATVAVKPFLSGAAV